MFRLVPMRFAKKPYTPEIERELTLQLKKQPNRISDTPVCDFCAGLPITAIYGANRMTTGEERLCWRWCSCGDCERVVDRNQWDDFHQRVAERLRQCLPPAVPSEIITQAVWATLANFFKDVSRIEG